MGQLRCQCHDGEGPPSQEASSCQVFSSLCRGRRISKLSEVWTNRGETVEKQKIYSWGQGSEVNMCKVKRCTESRERMHAPTLHSTH